MIHSPGWLDASRGRTLATWYIRNEGAQGEDGCAVEDVVWGSGGMWWAVEEGGAWRRGGVVVGRDGRVMF